MWLEGLGLRFYCVLGASGLRRYRAEQASTFQHIGFSEAGLKIGVHTRQSALLQVAVGAYAARGNCGIFASSKLDEHI